MLAYGRRWLWCWHPEEWGLRLSRMNAEVTGNHWLLRIGPLVVFSKRVKTTLGMSDAERRAFRKRVQARVDHERRIFGP